MKNLIISTILTILLCSCINAINENDSPKPITKIDSVSVFKDIQLGTDSINVIIKMGDKLKIPLKKDSLEIEVLKINKFCYLGETSCDVETDVYIKISLNNISNTFPYFDLGWGSGSKKHQFPTVSCTTLEPYGGYYYVFNKLIFSIKEITPYPNSREELIDLSEKKLYYLNLTVLNKCTK